MRGNRSAILDSGAAALCRIEPETMMKRLRCFIAEVRASRPAMPSAPSAFGPARGRQLPDRLAATRAFVRLAPTLVRAYRLRFDDNLTGRNTGEPEPAVSWQRRKFRNRPSAALFLSAS